MAQNPSNLPSRINRIYAFKDHDLSLKLIFQNGYDITGLTAKLFYKDKFHTGLAEITISGQLATVTLSKNDFLSINLPVFELFIYNNQGISILGATVEVSAKPGNPVLETFNISLIEGEIISVEIVDAQASIDASQRAEQAAIEATQANEEAQAIVPTLQTDISNKVPKVTTINGKALTSNISLNKTDIGIPNVDNTSDVNKPISTLQQAGLDSRIPLTQKGVANGVATYEQLEIKVSRFATINQATLQSIITSIGSTPTTIILDRTLNITTGTLSIPNNIKIDWIPTALFNVSLGATLIINSPINEGFQRLFSGDGSIILNGSTEITPAFFGATMDGFSDDRDYFVKTLACASISKVSVLIEKPIFLNILDDINKPIFIDDNIHIVGRGLGNIIVNNKYIPAFILPLSKNCSFDITIYYDGQYDASQYGYVEGSTTETKSTRFTNTIYKTYLTQKRGIIFTGSYNPRALTYASSWAMFMLKGAEYIDFSNIKIISKGSTPDKFVVWGFKLVRERERNTTIDSSTANNYTHCSNISFSNIEFDGVLMGIQGGAKDISLSGIVGKRYSDAQNADGSFIGGYNYDGLGSYWMSPPHLIYLNDENERLSILNTFDHGIRVGVTKSRPTDSGYCHSVKIKGENITIDGYTSYRPDGLGDIINGSKNISIKNIYASYDSSIFPAGINYTALRFPSDEDSVINPFENLDLSNITIKDENPQPRVFPIGQIIRGSQVTAKNIKVILNDFIGTSCSFAANGDNNDISFDVTLLNHTQTTDGVFQLNVNSNNSDIPIGRSNGKNNKYDITIKGWRALNNNSTYNNMKGRVTLCTADNPNNNQVKVNDLSNSFETFQNGILKQETWTRSQIVIAPLGNFSLITNFNIPAGWVIKTASVTTITAFGVANGLTSMSLGINTGSSDYIGSIPLTIGTTTKDLSLTDVASTSNRIVRLSAIGGSFDGTGSAKISFTITRIIQGE